MDDLGGEVHFLRDIAALLPKEAKPYEGSLRPGGLGTSLQARGLEGEAPDLQHSCALAYQVGQREFLER